MTQIDPVWSGTGSGEPEQISGRALYRTQFSGDRSFRVWDGGFLGWRHTSAIFRNFLKFSNFLANGSWTAETVQTYFAIVILGTKFKSAYKYEVISNKEASQDDRKKDDQIGPCKVTELEVLLLI